MKTKPKPKKTFRTATIRTLQVLTQPLCAGASDPDATTNVVMYAKNLAHFRAKTFPMFLRVDFIDWLLSYAADELHFQGVVNNVSNTDDMLVANCAAVAGLYMEWNFTVKEWQAQFVSGPFKGVKRNFGTGNLNPTFWARMWGNGILEAEGNFQSAGRGQQKVAAKKMLVLWCQAISANETDSFEQKWNLPETQKQMETPAKKLRLEGADGSDEEEEH